MAKKDKKQFKKLIRGMSPKDPQIVQLLIEAVLGVEDDEDDDWQGLTDAALTGLEQQLNDFSALVTKMIGDYEKEVKALKKELKEFKEGTQNNFAAVGVEMAKLAPFVVP